MNKVDKTSVQELINMIQLYLLDEEVEVEIQGYIAAQGTVRALQVLAEIETLLQSDLSDEALVAFLTEIGCRYTLDDTNDPSIPWKGWQGRENLQFLHKKLTHVLAQII